MNCKISNWLAETMRSGRSFGAVAFAVIALTQLTAVGQEVRSGANSIAPDAACQATLGDLAKATDRTELDRKLDRLIESAAADRGQLIAQLLWYSAEHKTEATTNALVGRVLKRLDVQKESIVTALAPHLDDRDEAVQSTVRDLLRGYEDRSATRPPDFSAYRAIIENDVRAGRPPQASLMKFMYESDPGAVLLVMVRAYQLRKPDDIKPILWGEHVVAELFWKQRFGFVEPTAVDAASMQEIEKLSRHDRWWVRLYVAQTIAMHPELGTPDLVDRLAADSNTLVKETMQTSNTQARQ